MTSPPPRLPPLSSLLKSRDVEDPINLWMHRPLAYGFVALVYRTSVTPNQITFLSLVVGVIAAGCWFVGTPQMMVAGGILLWTSAILDGADGILARAKRSFSDIGRALDGTADALVAAVSIIAAAYHMLAVGDGAIVLMLIPVAVVTTVIQIYLYDFYKESYMEMTNPNWDGIPERVEEVQQRLDTLLAERGGWVAIAAMHTYLGLVNAQTKAVALTNPWGSKQNLTFRVTEDSARNFRRFNLIPMRLWTALSLAPHTYMMSICAMFDRLDIYLWIRAVPACGVFVIALFWQRWASHRTRRDLDELGLAPVAA